MYYKFEKTTDVDEAAWASNELKVAVKNIEQDLTVLEEAVEQTKKDSKRFNIPPQELQERVNFITESRSHTQMLYKNVSVPVQGSAVRHKRNVCYFYLSQANSQLINCW